MKTSSEVLNPLLLLQTYQNRSSLKSASCNKKESIRKLNNALEDRIALEVQKNRKKDEESYEKAYNTLRFMSQTIDDFRYFFRQKSQEDEFRGAL
ncbi:MAG: hypothetical protein IBX43_06865 [Campylobacterales bacterium]|nr:hypothetical protein [Campylobacterales bacterium]